MSSYREVRRVRAAMSAATNHDVRKLIAQLNCRRDEFASRIIDPGTEAEQSATNAAVKVETADDEATADAALPAHPTFRQKIENAERDLSANKGVKWRKARRDV